MKKFLLLFLCLCFVGQATAEDKSMRRSSRRGEVAGYTSRNATVLSMMGWGVGLAAGIATLCALIDTNDGSSSSSHSH